MAIEIERKFLVNAERWQPPANGVLYRQGYIPTLDRRTVRVRVAGEQGYLTLKGPVDEQNMRLEFEYPIPLTDAIQMLEKLCEAPLIEKIRYKISIHNLLWEVDEFLGANQGLRIAEVELSEPNQAITLPNWIDYEVSGDRRYYNSYLVKNPYSGWFQQE
jgi:CYTH domain-containing protein